MTITADHATTSTTDRGILRCTTKGCRRAHTITFTVESETFAFNGRPAGRAHLVRADGRRVELNARYRLEDAMRSGFVCAGCKGHGATFATITGRYSASKPCNSRCVNAMSAACDCQCAGENHAAGHAA